MTTKTRPMTADELLRMPDDGFRYELVRGELNRIMPAGNYNGGVAGEIVWPLGMYVRANDLGRVFVADAGYLLESGPDTVLAPDGSFIRRERLELMGRVDGFWSGAPDLAIEVVSPSDRPGEVERKAARYIDAGARMVIVADPRSRTVRIHRPDAEPVELSDEDVIDGADVVPGWRLPVSDVFY